MPTIKSINKALASYHVELEKGEGYFYYVYDFGDSFATESVYCSHLSELSKQEWVDGGIAFAKKVESDKED